MKSVKSVKLSEDCVIGENVLLCVGVSVGHWCEIQDDCVIGEDAEIRSRTTLYRNVIVGANCTIGPDVLIQNGVGIGANCKIHSRSFICEGVVLAEGVFVGHGVIFCNERYPEAVRKESWELKDEDRVHVAEGATIGSGAVILPGVRIGEKAIIGAGAIVADDVPDGGTVISPKAVPIEKRHGNWGRFMN